MKTISSKLSKAALGPKFKITHVKKNDTEGLEDVMKAIYKIISWQKICLFFGESLHSSSRVFPEIYNNWAD